ncbi:hypothetical protein [uncultured Helicobacter sp.]|uniref:hypothetical protein n=1 Tax=uncultured Helicobacter sp. TaxID=175537 RepID=UPI003752EDC5
MKWLYTIVFVYSVLSLGCASYSVSVPSQDSVHKEYRDGVEILTSDMSRSLVHFEIAQHTIGGADNVPLAIFILAQVKTGQDFLFDWDCVLASQDNKRVEILSYEAAKQSNLDFGKAIESFGIFTPREKSSSQFSSTPSPMLIYRGYPGFVIYTPWVYSARDRIEQSERLEESRRKRSVILSSYLRKNTLKAGDALRGGFVVIDPSKLRHGVLEIQVKVATQIHLLKVMLEKR